MHISLTARRKRLTQLAALGLLGPAGISGLIQDALAKGDVPVVNGINALSGTVTVNDNPAKVGAPLKLGDKVSTAKGSTAVLVIGKDGFLMRDSTTVIFQGSNTKLGLVESVLITTGKVLAVFARRNDEKLTSGHAMPRSAFAVLVAISKSTTVAPIFACATVKRR